MGHDLISFHMWERRVEIFKMEEEQHNSSRGPNEGLFDRLPE
jgi:hypothetical protein